MKNKGKYIGTFNGQSRLQHEVENVDPYYQADERPARQIDKTFRSVEPGPVERRGLFGLFFTQRGPVQVGHKGAEVEIPENVKVRR